MPFMTLDYYFFVLLQPQIDLVVDMTQTKVFAFLGGLPTVRQAIFYSLPHSVRRDDELVGEMDAL